MPHPTLPNLALSFLFCHPLPSKTLPLQSLPCPTYSANPLRTHPCIPRLSCPVLPFQPFESNPRSAFQPISADPLPSAAGHSSHTSPVLPILSQSRHASPTQPHLFQSLPLRVCRPLPYRTLPKLSSPSLAFSAFPSQFGAHLTPPLPDSPVLPVQFTMELPLLTRFGCLTDVNGFQCR